MVAPARSAEPRPASFSPRPPGPVEPFVPLLIAAHRCKGCALCVLACAKAALAIDDSVVNALGYHPIRLTAIGSCTSCALCARVCPDCVLTVLAPRRDTAR
jgi:2-oxoglutarate ferredoxin oxidoreductase subunit delta